ncbi:unnamed protein product [Discula destructiva]
MLSLCQLFAAVVVAAAAVDAAFGPAFSTGPVATDSFIRESTATLILPDTPSGSVGVFSLWVGMGTSDGDLIQSISDNDQSLAGNPQQDQWGVFAYTLQSSSATTQEPVQTTRKIFAAGDHVTMHYKYDDASKNYTQTVLVNDVQTATLATDSGIAQGWGSATECAETDCGTVPAHSWVNVTITLDVADPNYDQTLGKSDGVTGSMSTQDGGLTWDIGTIEIPEYTF